MVIRKKIKVLIVDDSIIFRETLAKAISSDDAINLVGTASDAYEARDKIIELMPDVITLDVEMPRMNGIEFLKRLMPQYPLPVVVISALSQNLFEALNAGAVDFVTKPDAKSSQILEQFHKELLVKIKIASIANVSRWKANYVPKEIMKSTDTVKHTNIIAIGASTGGTEAINMILANLPRNMPGIVVVQHMPPVFTKMYAERINSSCLLEVREAQNGDLVLPGRVLIAPGEYHMKVKKAGKEFIVECMRGEKVNGHCPSVDVLFESVANSVGSSAIGVILTGMGSDGAKGLLSMRNKGAITLGQDEISSVVYGMPKCAFNIGAVQRQVNLESMAQAIYSLVRV